MVTAGRRSAGQTADHVIGPWPSHGAADPKPLGSARCALQEGREGEPTCRWSDGGTVCLHQPGTYGLTMYWVTLDGGVLCALAAARTKAAWISEGPTVGSFFHTLRKKL